MEMHNELKIPQVRHTIWDKLKAIMSYGET